MYITPRSVSESIGSGWSTLNVNPTTVLLALTDEPSTGGGESGWREAWIWTMEWLQRICMSLLAYRLSLKFRRMNPSPTAHRPSYDPRTHATHRLALACKSLHGLVLLRPISPAYIPHPLLDHIFWTDHRPTPGACPDRSHHAAAIQH